MQQLAMPAADAEEADTTKYLLDLYAECGAKMRAYEDDRFKIATLAIAIASAVLTIQQAFPATATALALGLVGLVATQCLFSIQFRQQQAWTAIYNWVERNIEGRLAPIFGKEQGPLTAIRTQCPKPWYVWRATKAFNRLYLALMVIWTADVLYYTYRVVEKLLP